MQNYALILSICCAPSFANADILRDFKEICVPNSPDLSAIKKAADTVGYITDTDQEKQFVAVHPETSIILSADIGNKGDDISFACIMLVEQKEKNSDLGTRFFKTFEATAYNGIAIKDIAGSSYILNYDSFEEDDGTVETIGMLLE